MVEPAHLVVCHTRDRPESLAATLRTAAEHLSHGPEEPRPGLLLVDDSVRTDHRLANRAILREQSSLSAEYFGAEEHAGLLSECTSELGFRGVDLGRFMRPLGSAAWDPAAARNAAVLALLRRRPAPSVVVTLDDDIVLPSATHDCLGALADLVVGEPALVCSATLTGKEDASLFFRALAELRPDPTARFEPPVPIRSGLMAFHSRWVREVPFPRCYSEDWVWALALASAGAALRRVPLLALHTGERELVLDPEILHRECLGEALVSGFRLALDGAFDEKSPLRSREHWVEVLAVEVRETEDLVRGVEGSGMAWEILRHTLRTIRSMSPDEPQAFACDYLDGLAIWREITSRVVEFEPGGRSRP